MNDREYTAEEEAEYQKRMDKRAAKALVKKTGMKYTEALRQVRQERETK